jgi:hypothetical protein
MLRSALLAGSSAAAILAAIWISPAVGQNPPPANPAQPPAARPADKTAAPRAYRAKDLLGAKLFIQGNTTVGTIDDIVFNEDGVIDYLIVQTADNKLVTTPWPAAKFDWNKRTVMVPLTQEQFRAIPTYTVQTYPQFYTPAYRTEIYRFYNLTPGQERRLERQERRQDRRP